jgi:uncharacterized protein YndB with AHSA1/START domain
MNRDTFRPGPLAEVDCQASDGRWTLVFVRDLRQPPEKVWAALTDPVQLGAWAPYRASRDLCEPGDVTLMMIDGDTSEPMAATVTRAERPSLLEYTLGTDLLRWELTATGHGTRLVLRHTVTDRGWLPKVAAGWHLCLDVAEHLLDGHPIGPIRGSEALDFGWDDLRDAYATKLGVHSTDTRGGEQLSR